MSQFLFFYLRVSQNKVTLRLKENFNIAPFDKNALLRISALPPPPGHRPLFRGNDSSDLLRSRTKEHKTDEQVHYSDAIFTKLTDVCMHKTILPPHNFGWGAYYITLKDTNTCCKEKNYPKV